MSHVLKLNDILASLSDSMEKTAEDASAEDSKSEDKGSSKSKEDLKAMLFKKKDSKAESEEDEEEEESEEDEKAAGWRPQPYDDLEKIAHSVASAEEEAIVKEAQLYGASVCDGFMSRLNQYEDAAGEIAPTEKTAAPVYGPAPAPSGYNRYAQPQQSQPAEYAGFDMEKLAEQGIYQEDLEAADEFIKAAAADGHRVSYDEALEKVAEYSYQQGYQQTMEKAGEQAFYAGVSQTMEKAAEVAYNDGFEDTMESAAVMLKEAGETEAVEAMEKAAFDSGYEDAMEKIASSAFEQGASDMANLFEQVS